MCFINFLEHKLPKLYMLYAVFIEVGLECELNKKFFHLFISGYTIRSPLPLPEHKGAADAGGKAEGGRQGPWHTGECSRGLAEVQPQVLIVQ